MKKITLILIVFLLVFSLTVQPALSKNSSTNPAQAKVSITKNGPKQAPPGSIGTYQIKIENVGNIKATNVKVQDKLPALEHFVSANPPASSATHDPLYGNTTLVWNIGSLDVGEEKIITYSVQFPNIQQGCIRLKNEASVFNDSILLGDTLFETWICVIVPQPSPKPPKPNPINITINPPERICINTNSKFVFTFTGGTAPYQYTVGFGDGTEEIKGKESGKFVALLHNYTEEGMYTISIDVKDSKGTQSKLTRGVKAENCEVVLKVYHHNFIIGYPDGNFKSDRNVTRAEIATMLTRALGLDAEHIFSHTLPFTDVKQKHWVFNFIKKAYEEKLMLGDKENTFRPDSFATRAEIATVLVRLRGLQPETPEEQLFSDVRSSDWFNGYIYTAVKAGLIQGYPDHTFKPNKSVTRAEFVTMLDRTLYREDIPQVEQFKGLENVRMFPDVAKDFWAYKYILEAAFPHIVTYATRAPMNMSIPSKTIPVYLASTKTVIVFPSLNTTITAIVPVDGIINGKDPLERNIYVRIINKEKP